MPTEPVFSFDLLHCPETVLRELEICTKSVQRAEVPERLLCGIIGNLC
jgi:hypothetical protein